MFWHKDPQKERDKKTDRDRRSANHGSVNMTEEGKRKKKEKKSKGQRSSIIRERGSVTNTSQIPDGSIYFTTSRGTVCFLSSVSLPAHMHTHVHTHWSHVFCLIAIENKKNHGCPRPVVVLSAVGTAGKRHELNFTTATAGFTPEIRDLFHVLVFSKCVYRSWQQTKQRLSWVIRRTFLIQMLFCFQDTHTVLKVPLNGYFLLELDLLEQ